MVRSEHTHSKCRFKPTQNRVFTPNPPNKNLNKLKFYIFTIFTTNKFIKQKINIFFYTNTYYKGNCVNCKLMIPSVITN